MHAEWFGDSYDIVKRFFIRVLREAGYQVYVDPMFTGDWKEIEESFYAFLGAKPMSHTFLPKGNKVLLLDPDTGIGQRKTKQHVTLDRIVRELDTYDVVFSFDQSFSRGIPSDLQMGEKLQRLNSLGAYGFYYDSHAKFLFSAKSVDKLNGLRSLFAATGLPSTRLWG